MKHRTQLHSTTVIGVIRDDKVAIGSDGQMTLGGTILKHRTKKVRKIYNDSVLVGFAGGTSDAITLFERFEEKLNASNGKLERAAVELTKEWRTDKYLRKLEAMLVVLSRERALILSGTGDVIEPDDKLVAIGSGGPYAVSSAKALLRHTKKSAREIVEESLSIASEICIYTNEFFTIEEL